jgi:hypothetical protein
MVLVEQGIQLKPYEQWIGSFWGLLIVANAYAGEREALQILDQKGNLMPSIGMPGFVGSWSFLMSAVEGLMVLGEREKAATLYPMVIEALSAGTVIVPFLPTLVQKIAGIAAAAGKQWGDAEQHFVTALRQAHEIPSRPEQPEVRRWYARMLIERNAPGDHATARMMIEEAIKSYREIGMLKHVEMAQDLARLLPAV